MSTDTSIEKRACIACDSLQPVSKNVIARHLVTTEQTGAVPFSDGWVCIGSTLPGKRDDEFDATRFYGAQRAALASKSAIKLRAEMAAALANESAWETAAILTHYGTTVVHYETLARLWREFAAAANPLYVIKDVLAMLRSNTRGSLIDAVVTDAKASAARQFMVEIRHELERAYPNGWNAEQVFTAFFSL